MRNLAGKTALVTGAAGGIGRAVALRLAREGMRLVLVDIDGFGAAQTARDAERIGAEADTLPCNIADTNQVESLVDELLDRYAGVDLLVNNAGVTYHGTTHSMPEEEWDRLMAVNLCGPLMLTRKLLPSLLARPEAHVLNVASVLGLSAMPRVSLYSTTKFAMVGFSESLRSEYGRSGLGVTTLCPGFVKTGLFTSARPQREGVAPKCPPAWLCLSPEWVAKRAVRAIKRNRGRVVIDPYCGWIRRFQATFPTLWDAILALGRGRRVAKKHRALEALHPDPEQALRLKLGLAQQGPAVEAEQRRAA